MLNRYKYHVLFIIYIFPILFTCTCSNGSISPTTYKSPEGYKEVQNSYNSVLRTWQVPYERKFIKTSFGDTHIITWGKKNNPPLILFHGGGNCALMWIFIAEQLANHYYVIAPDTIGDIGLSIPTKPFLTTKDYTEWFSELVNNLGFSKINIAGISWGGGIALQIALQYPERINKTVLMCPAWGLEICRIWALLYHSLPAALFPNPERVRNLLGWLSVKRPTFADSKGDALVNYLVIALKYYKSPKSVKPIIFTDKELMQLKIPTLLMIGDKEVIYSNPDKVIAKAKNNIPNIQVIKISQAGHALIYDQPDLICKKMIEFLNRDKMK